MTVVGYDGSFKEMIADYVHLQFLKAKAEASAKQAMKGDTSADHCWDSCKVELATLEKR